MRTIRSVEKTVWIGALAAGFVCLYANDAPEPQMVDLNVVALDNHGEPVTDLKLDEFRLTDNGKPQSIAFFRHRDSSLGAVPALGLGEISNRGGNNVPHATLILFDLLNQRFGTRGVTANQLVHDLQSMENADYLFLYCLSLDGRIFPVRGLPGPESQPPSPGSPPWTRQIKPLVDGAMGALTKVRPVDDLDVNYRVQITYDALAQVASELERVPGRKSLVWLTDGVPIEIGPNRSDTGEPVDFTPLLRYMSQAFDRSGVAIYPVRRVMIGSPDSMGGPGTTGGGSLATLDLFAQLTGGRPDGGKDIAAAVRQAVSDMRTSYQIGYFPPAGNWDDKLHKLHVTCTRKGVRIQAKTSYYAWHEPAGARSQEAIKSAVRTTFDAAEIGLRGSVSLDAKAANRVHLDAHIDARDLVLTQGTDGYRGELRVALVGYGTAGQAIPSRVVPMDLHLTQQEYEKTLREGVHLAQDVAVPEDVEKVRLIVFDRGSTAIGSLTIPVPENRGKSR